MTADKFRLYLAVLLTLFVVGTLLIGFKLADKEPYSENGRFITTTDGNGSVWVIDSQTGRVTKSP